MIATSVRAGRKTGFAESISLFIVAVLGLALLTLSGSSKPLFVAGLLLAFAGAWGWQGVMNLMVIRTVDLPPGTATGAVASGTYLGTVGVPAVVGLVVSGSPIRWSSRVSRRSWWSP
ncbi:MAG: hypothetical protein GEU81_02895 [Nitriliruptorales bacterium]|nr:hypothetical protein [Nitriliruptorales bacterium]